MKDAIFKMIRDSTPDSDGLIEIQSRYGTKRISSTRFAEITLEAEERSADGEYRIDPDKFDRLLLEEVTTLSSRVSRQPDSIQSIAGDDHLVFDFFENFSRFECALKRTGFVKGDSYQNALPDWDTFARERLDPKIASIADAAFKEAYSYLLQRAPQKQKFVESDKSMRWKENSKREEESEAQHLLRLVRDVRNNLFHGGKYSVSQGGPITDERVRNAELLQACSTILDKCRSLDPDVERYFAETLGHPSARKTPVNAS